MFFTEVKCKGNTQITHKEETQKCHGVIRLLTGDDHIFFFVLVKNEKGCRKNFHVIKIFDRVLTLNLFVKPFIYIPTLHLFTNA